MIRFERVDIQNFNSIGNIENFQFQEGIHAVKGLNLDEERSKSNGSGKSSFFDAITWCIYGKTPSGKSADDIVNRKFGYNCYVKLWFSIGDMSYRIERYRKHEVEDNNIKVFINEQDKTVHPPTKNQEVIDDIINVPFDLFTSSFIISQGLRNRFTALTDFQRKEMIENIRNNKVWDVTRDLVRNDLKDIEDEIEEIEKEIGKKEELSESYQSELRDIKSNIKDLKNQKKELNDEFDSEQKSKDLEELEKDKKEVEKTLSNLKDRKKELESQLSQKNKEMSNIPDKINTLREEIEEYEDVFDLNDLLEEKEEREQDLEELTEELELEEDKELLQIQKDDLENQKKELEDVKKEHEEKKSEFNQLENKVEKLENKIDSSQEKIDFYEHYLEEDHDKEECPTCGHVPEEDEEERIQERYEQELSTMADLRTEHEEYNKKCNQVEGEVGDWEDKVHSKKGVISDVEKEIEEIQQRISRKEKKTNKIEGQIQSVDNKISEIRSNLEEMGISGDDLSEVRSKIEENQGKISDLEDSRSQLKEEVQELENKKKSCQESITAAESKGKTLDDEISDLREEIQEHEKSVSSITTQLKVKTEDLQKKAEKRKETVDRKKELIEIRRNEEEKLPVYENLDKIFSPKGIRAHIISKDISFINQRLDFYSKHFFSDMYVQLDPGIDEDGKVSKIDIPVSTTMDFEKTYEDCSGGERRRIDICIQLAIFDLILSISSVTTNMLVLDEVFEGLDSEGVKAVMDVVKQISQEGSSIFIISHLPNLGEHIEDNVTFVKENGVTSLEQSMENVIAA